jgi:FkbM family methyltransferase
MSHLAPGSRPWFGALTHVGRFVSRHRRDRSIRSLAALCERYLSWYENANYDLHTNGESFVLDILGNARPRVIFDVGANIGDWTLEASRRCPGAQIHAFEVAPPTFERLTANVAALTNVRCCMAGLSDAEGPIRMRYYGTLPSLTTATAYPHSLPYSEIEGTVTTGDAYVASNRIEHIDLLKIDVEGMEQQVLKGFEATLARKAIDLVQFEYGRVSIVNGFLLRDFHEFFRTRGYLVGKIFPTYVEFRDYALADEDFIGPNYLACREGRPDLAKALARGTVP